MGFVKNTKYYRGTVYEWNLPTGSSCPFAMECKVTVDRVSGKFNNQSSEYKCYAAAPERFPGVRNHRWNNFDNGKRGVIDPLPKGCRHVRIHAAGDFFSQSYFDTWLEYCRAHPDVEFWAYTKSLIYWGNRIDKIPSNLILTASYGGRLDQLIESHNLKNVRIYPSALFVPPDRPVDTNDDYARIPHINFALIDNYAK
jgi:hypothetical protein